MEDWLYGCFGRLENWFGRLLVGRMVVLEGWLLVVVLARATAGGRLDQQSGISFGRILVVGMWLSQWQHWSNQQSGILAADIGCMEDWYWETGRLVWEIGGFTNSFGL